MKTRKLLTVTPYTIVPFTLISFYIYLSRNFSTNSSSFSPKEDEIVVEIPSKDKGIEKYGILPIPPSSTPKEKRIEKYEILPTPPSSPFKEKEIEKYEIPPTPPSSPFKENDSRNGVVQHEKRIEKYEILPTPPSSPFKGTDFTLSERGIKKYGILPTPPSSPPKEKRIEKYKILPTPPSSPSKENDSRNGVVQHGNTIKTPSTCDYTNGRWVRDNSGPLYDASCGMISYAQNCINHGRPDTGYLYWKWKPKQCDLQRFDPRPFLHIIKGKHLAFVGDSLARNQVESLLCMLASVSPPNLVYRSGDDEKFRRWHFPSHNAVVSVYWSPFLVKGFQEKDAGKLNPHRLYFDSIDESWGSDLDSIDMVVLSIGNWFLQPALYFDGDVMLGCFSVEDMDCTYIEFFRMFGKAFNTALRKIIEHKVLRGDGIDVIVTTVSPNHFIGGWDEFGVCNKTKPFREGEKIVEGTDAYLWKFQMDEVEYAKVWLNTHQNSFPNVRVAALDVTKLSTLRPDGHPGPYMHFNPFPDGVKKPIQNDCVHWCMPGAVDTWNEIMLDIMKRWHPYHQ